MYIKSLIIAGSVLFGASAMAQQSTQNQTPVNQNQQQPQTPGSKQPNAQGEQPTAGRTMQEKDTGLMNQSGGAPGASGSSGTQSGSSPGADTKK
jgi:hypothetical protein